MKLTMLMGQYPQEERDRRRQAVLRCAMPTTEVSFVELAGTFYSNESGAVASMLMTSKVCRAAIQAESNGADAVVTFGSLDPGVEAAAHFVDIPVLGSGRTGYNVAAMLGRRIASIVYVQNSIPHARRLVREFGVEDKVVSIRSVNIGLQDSTKSAQSGVLLERLVQLGRQAVEEDEAEVLFPQGVSMVPLHCEAKELSKLIGMPVVDGLAASVRMAEYFADTGVTNSRVAYPRLTWSSEWP